MRIGEKLRRVREARGLSQSALARRAKVGRISLVRIEQGAQEPTVRTLDKLARALRITTGDLIVPTSVLSGEVRRLLGLRPRQWPSRSPINRVGRRGGA
ncbi:MAG: helix-turn-helix transcriptional regulator [Candidatus Rokubacteria bacterium]|nr:helix-turn-helix transcriptional regulator [Candidatus Rokubacteria bacterium]